MAEGWPTEHTEHTEEFLIGGNGEGGGRRAEGVWPAPNPRAGKPVPRGMGFPAHVGATADRRADGGGLAHGTHGTHGRIFDRRERRGRRTENGERRGDGGRRTSHSRVAPSRNGPTGNDVTRLQISVGEELLASAGVDPAKAGEEFRVLAAAKLFELRRITFGQASRLAAFLGPI